MFARKRRDPVWLQILRVLLRVACIVFLVLYIFVFVGEGDFSCLKPPFCLKNLRLIFVPGLFLVAFIITFFKERFSGFLMILSVILYNLVLWIDFKDLSLLPRYLGLVAVGLGFIFLSKLSKRYGYYSNYYHNHYMG